MSDDIKGDVLVIQGDMEPEIKFVSVCEFTKSVKDPDEEINCNRFYPRVLLATAGSIGARLDAADVYCVIRVGFPTSIIDMVQEMGRCSRGRLNLDGVMTDGFHMILSLFDFVYMNEKLYLSSVSSTGKPSEADKPGRLSSEHNHIGRPSRSATDATNRTNAT